MAHAKDKHYWRQLRSVLTAGLWDVSTPARTPNGHPLSWSELLRKFNKHNPGHLDVSELASQTQALSLLLGANSSDRSFDGNDVSRHGSLVLGEECTLPEERVQEAAAGFEALKKLSSSTDSVRMTLAYFSYAMGRYKECLDTLSTVNVSDPQGTVSVPGTIRSTALSLQVPGTGSDLSISSRTASMVSTVSVADINDGRSLAVVESIRSICLQGMSHEKLSPDDSRPALSAYLKARPLIGTVTSEIDIPAPVPTKVTPFGTGNLESGSFSRYRELWRWVERLLRRAIILAARIVDLQRENEDHTMLWSLFDQYQTCSAHWPPKFRPEQRSVVSVLHLRALILRARLSPSSPLPAQTNSEKPHRWAITARDVIQAYRAILSVTTRFPRAGERNVKVEDLVDLSVAVWEADGAVGEYAGWVIDMLWWATRLTFNSYKVFRHMSRLLYVAGNPELAKRTLRLYVQVVGKAREASLAQSSSERDDTGGELGVGSDTDTDQYWVKTLTHGARMLCRLALTENDECTAIEECKEAKDLIEKAKTRLDSSDKELLGGIQLAEGILNFVMAHTERDPHTRPDQLHEALSLLLSAAETHPTPSVYHHLALAFARPGPSQDIQEAIKHARSAVEGDSLEIRHWHLLGLLLVINGDWKAAKAVLEIGAGMCEPPPDDENNGQLRPSNGDAGNSLPNGNGHSHPPDPQTQTQDAPSEHPVVVISGDMIDLPPSETLLTPLPDRPNASRQDMFERLLQLRMTQLALSEMVEGPEGAGDKWVEVFQWFSERREAAVDDRRVSIDSRRASVDLKPPSEVVTARPSMQHTEKRLSTIYSPGEVEVDQAMPLPLPTTVITPATPGITGPAHSYEMPEAPYTGDDRSNEKRSASLDENGVSKVKKARDEVKKAREVFKSGVHKGQVRITTMTKKIGQNVGRHSSVRLGRSISTPDFHAMLNHSSYQASSIHLRHHLSMHASQQDLMLPEAPPPPPAQLPTPPHQRQKYRAARDRRLLSNLWLMSAATFRRLGKIEQAKAAIQEAEVSDESNPAVWVQLGLYHMALNNERRALEAFQKALFIAPDDVSATVHLCRVYMSMSQKSCTDGAAPQADRDNVDLAVGLLSDLTRGVGWDVSEAWYFLAKLHGLQGRKDRERECLGFALKLAETRGVRDIGVAVGWCL